jgi:hypothetical protein
MIKYKIAREKKKQMLQRIRKPYVQNPVFLESLGNQELVSICVRYVLFFLSGM